MQIVFTDKNTGDSLYPFTATRSAADIRIGILTIREKWALILAALGYDKNENTLTFNSNIVPTKNYVELFGHLDHADIPVVHGADDIRVLQHPWDLFQFNDWALRKDFALITEGRSSQPISTTNKVINPEQIFIEDGAKVEYSILNASEGPIYIGKNAEVMEGAMIRGSFALCEGAVVKMGSKIYGATTVGPYCTVAGEIKNTILFGYSNKAHDGYLGDSVIGEWCNLGAGTTNSNVKNTASEVAVWFKPDMTYRKVGLKCGLLMGDYSRAAINTSFNTGTVVGVCCNIFAEGFPPKYIPDFTWGNDQYTFEKALQDIENWKRLKGKTITQNEKEILNELYNK
ncbi:glucose-1-phosphate thymidylyltransferase [Ferruginibacter lapsinanis]|uniref:putative sugar nucleotidyl transferase n=1 Tax=Ferruginibacter lapsinanis TaxID=563172 RepID=UPI001E5E2784|nr:putative sugar nucleotidyl transferase [Ferruginibacter lapsinanis]UEG49785.1 glucose-1-phosphate thymidylyltransferase [Ferruginibacter lapsinanis]